jgi:hypothetical protein
LNKIFEKATKRCQYFLDDLNHLPAMILIIIFHLTWLLIYISFKSELNTFPMETILLTLKKSLKKDGCFSEDELESMGVFPTNLQCFTYFNYQLYQKGNKRIILKPLRQHFFQVLRIYDFMPA